MKKTNKKIVHRHPEMPEPLDFEAGDLIPLAQVRRRMSSRSTILLPTQAAPGKLSEQRLQSINSK